MNATNTRRTLLKVAAAIGGSSIVGTGVILAQDDSDGDGEPDFRLGGRQSGWQGVAPSDIEGETNPTLELTAGQDYVLEWENLDGSGHNFIIEDENGEDLVETDIITSGTQTVEFTASEEMAEYYCQPHPTSMRGDVEVSADGGGSGGESEDFAAAVDEVFELTLTDDGWQVEGTEIGSEDQSTDESGADGNQTADGEGTEDGDGSTEADTTLELEAGGVYVLRWSNSLDPAAVTDDEDDGSGNQTDGGVGNETDDGGGNQTDDETEVAGAGPQQRPSELVVLNDDDEEVVRSDPAGVQGSAALVFVATTDLATYRDAETGAEGEFEVQESEDGENGDGENGDGENGDGENGDGGDDSDSN